MTFKSSEAPRSRALPFNATQQSSGTQWRFTSDKGMFLEMECVPEWAVTLVYLPCTPVLDSTSKQAQHTKALLNCMIWNHLQCNIIFFVQ